MNLEILSFGKALKYVPEKRSYGIRIFDGLQQTPILDLLESDNWMGISSYSFDDIWPSYWSEYSWIDLESSLVKMIFGKSWEELHETFPSMTKESLISYLESRGQPEGRCTLFNKNTAKDILKDYEKLAENVDNVIIHCNHGENRSPAVGIAMNEIYNWGIEGLKEKFPNYRKFIYKILKDAS